MVWLQIALFVISTVISYRLRPRPEAPRASSLQDVNAPTADATRAIPKLYGTKWVKGPNVLWFGDLSTRAITKKGARRYGIAGPKEDITVGYRYFLGMHLGLCQSRGVLTVLGINVDEKEAWRGFAGSGESIFVDEPELFGGDDREGGVSGNIDVMLGEDDQEINEYLAARLSAPLPAYRGIVSLVAKRFYIGTSTYMKPWSVLVSSITDKPFTGGAEFESLPSTHFVESGGVVAEDIHTDGDGVWITYTLNQEVNTSRLRIFRSTDNGRTWNIVLSILGSDHGLNLTSSNRIGIAYGNSRWVMAVMPVNSGEFSIQDHAVIISTDRGVTWGEPIIFTDLGVNISSGHLIFTGERFLMVRSRVPTGPATGAWFAHSTHGNLWTVGPTIDENPGNHPVAAANDVGEVCVFAPGASVSGGGLILRSPSGTTFTEIGRYIETASGFFALQSASIDAGEYRGDETVWIAAVRGSPVPEMGGLRSVNNGHDWTPFAWPGAQNICGVISDRRGNWIAVGSSSRVLRSTDEGETWEEVDVGGLPVTMGAHGATDYKGNWVLQANSTTRNVFYNIDGPKPDILNGDMNPADIIAEALTDPIAGLGYGEDMLTTGSAFGSFDYARQLFDDERFGLSFLESFQGKVEDFIRSVQEHADCAVQVDPITGKWIIVPVRDDYDPADPALPTADTANVVELVNFRRPGYGDLINQITVVYDDRLTATEQSVTVQNNAVLAVQGVVSTQTNTYPGISRADIANLVASRDLRQLSTPLAEVELLLHPSFGIQLRAGSVFRWNWSPLGISGMVLRVVAINYGDLLNGEVRVQCVEDVFATATPLFDAPPVSNWSPPASDPEPVDNRVVLEAPYLLLLTDVLGDTADLTTVVDGERGVPIVLAEAPTGDALRYEIQTSTGAAFAADGESNFTEALIIPASLPAEIESTIVFPSGTNVLDAAIGDAALLDGEWVQIIDRVNLTITLKRGVMDSVPVPHAAGSILWLIGTGLGQAATARADGTEATVRLLTETATGKLAIEDLDEVEPTGTDPGRTAIEDTVTMAHRAVRPYPPGDFKIAGERWPLQLELIPPLTVSWAHRDRLAQGEQLIAQNDPDIGPEAGTTYRLRVTGASGGTLLDQSGISATSFDLEEAHMGDIGLLIELWSVRDGYESFEAQSHLVFTATGLGFALGLNLGGLGFAFVEMTVDHGVNTSSSEHGRAAPVYCPSNGKLYISNRKYDGTTGVFEFEWPRTFEVIEQTATRSISLTTWITVDAWLPTEDALIGRRFLRRDTSTGGFTYTGTTIEKVVINQSTNELEVIE